MFEKRLETLETQHRRAAISYLVGNRGGASLLFLPTTRGGWGRRPPLLPLPRQARWIGVALDGGVPDLVLVRAGAAPLEKVVAGPAGAMTALMEKVADELEKAAAS